MGLTKVDIPQQDNNFKADSTGANINRFVGQTLTFGLQDEIDAFLKSAFNKDLTYSDALKNERQQLEKFKENNFGKAFLAEMAGGLPYARFGVGKNLLSTFIRNAGMGGAYGAGTGEGLEDRVKNAGITAGISGTLGTLLSKILPKRSPEAKKLTGDTLGFFPDVELTPGQANKGTLIGNILDYFEKRATSLPVIGDFISSAFERGSRDFQLKIFQDFADSVGITLKGDLKDLNQNELFSQILVGYRNKYNNAVSKLTLDKTSFVDEVTQFAKNKGFNDNQIQDILRRVTDKIYNETGDKISGTAIQDTDRFLRDLKNDSNLDAFYKGIYKHIYDNIFSKNLIMNSKTGAMTSYNKVKKYYPYLDTIERSVNKNTDIITPSNVLNASKVSGGSVKYAQGQAPYQDIATTAKKVIGDKVADSGTQSRLDTKSLLLGGGVGAGYAMGQGTTDALMAIGGASIPFASYATPITNKLVTNFAIPGASAYARSATNPGSVEFKDRGIMMMKNNGLLGE